MSGKFNRFVVGCVVLFAVLISQFFIFQPADIPNNIDGSWQYTLSSLRNSPQQLGSTILYTYGPMFERIASYPTPRDSAEDWVVGLGFFLLLLTGATYTLLQFINNGQQNKFKNIPRNTLLVLGLFALTSPTIDSMYYLTLGLGLVAIRWESATRRRLLLVAALTPFALYKVSFSVAILVLLIPAFVSLPITLKQFKRLAYEYTVSLIIFSLVFGLASSSGPHYIVRYLHYGLVNSAAYTEFMGLSYNENKAIMAAYVVIYLSTLIVTASIFLCKWRQKRSARDLDQQLTILLLYMVGYFVLKQAVVRSDTLHLLAFLPFVPLCFMAALLPLGPVFGSKPLRQVSGDTVIYACLILGVVMQLILLKPLLPGKHPGTYLHGKASTLANVITRNPLLYGSFQQQQQETKRLLASRANSSKRVRSYLEKHYPLSRGITYFGNTTSIGDTIDRRRSVTYLPFVQTYAAFPPQLFDGQYIASLQKRPNDLLYVEELEPSVNERIPSHELNNFFQYLIHNYKLVYSDQGNRQFLLEPISQKVEQCTVKSSITTKKSQPIPIPVLALTKNEYIKLRVTELSGTDEALLSLFLKKPLYSIELITPDGSGLRRTTESTLEHGIAVTPFYFSYNDIVNRTPVELSAVSVHGGVDTNRPSKATFERCRFQ